MGWETHLLTGALTGYMVTQQPLGAVVGGIAGLVPDIDEPKSKLGRLVPMLAKQLKHTLGHRTFTHSLVFVLLVGVLIQWLTQNNMMTTAAVAGLCSHIIADMLTGRVQIFYPLPVKLGIRMNKRQAKRMDTGAKYLISIACFVMIYYAFR
ncbi:membrane protein [Lysinibacillus alkalisoli]|uniref:Membrane protein n=1 Tax=Lysinibacillus alkalisoli TaxID=1911548 RepID=A0A917GA36_9BACI|nr:metal-dependent hydrolase [Lysinibacillus alkalisoli]GGG31686.1 membrane protein [Lysinibacillus alkalisoli]